MKLLTTIIFGLQRQVELISVSSSGPERFKGEHFVHLICLYALDVYFIIIQFPNDIFTNIVYVGGVVINTINHL